MEIGLYTFGDITPDPHSGSAISPRQRYAEILAAATLADAAGLDVFGVGEHHRLDISIASPAVVMAAIAGQTKRIRLTSAVTVLSTLDPVRVFQDFATVDLLSGGRAELIAGRGAYRESFALFGDDVADYDALFAEKLDLLLEINAGARVTWRGRYRSPLSDAEISPRPVNALPIWLGIGGTPESALRAGTLGLPVTLANITQPPENFAGQIAAYRQRYAETGRGAGAPRVAIATHLHIARDSQSARDDFYPYYRAYVGGHSPRPGLVRAVSREVYDQRLGPAGPIFVGSPQQIIDKLGYEHELFGHDRFLAQLDIGGLPYAKVARAIELLATEVLPAVRNLKPSAAQRGGVLGTNGSIDG
jgi:alkanesulfonate monooxygenase SsuD/methylene tetrahydromethanopterin reductase-like flavin-dependent oxidoreductase (luciferase family)